MCFVLFQPPYGRATHSANTSPSLPLEYVDAAPKRAEVVLDKAFINNPTTSPLKQLYWCVNEDFLPVYAVGEGEAEEAKKTSYLIEEF